jgi:hypothetical protein
MTTIINDLTGVVVLGGVAVGGYLYWQCAKDVGWSPIAVFTCWVGKAGNEIIDQGGKAADQAGKDASKIGCEIVGDCPADGSQFGGGSSTVTTGWQPYADPNYKGTYFDWVNCQKIGTFTDPQLQTWCSQLGDSIFGSQTGFHPLYKPVLPMPLHQDGKPNDPNANKIAIYNRNILKQNITSPNVFEFVPGCGNAGGKLSKDAFGIVKCTLGAGDSQGIAYTTGKTLTFLPLDG